MCESGIRHTGFRKWTEAMECNRFFFSGQKERTEDHSFRISSLQHETEEYDDFLNDPNAFTFINILPRVFGNLRRWLLCAAHTSVCFKANTGCHFPQLWLNLKSLKCNGNILQIQRGRSGAYGSGGQLRGGKGKETDWLFRRVAVLRGPRLI